MTHARRPGGAAAMIAAGTTLAVLGALLGTPVADAAPQRGKASATWDSTSFVAGQGQVVVHGKVPGGKRKIQLQVRTRSGWSTLTSKRSKRNGTYALSAPLDWYGTHKVRVQALGRPAFTKSTKVTVSTGYTPVGDPADYALLGPSIAKTWRFDPCSTVTYKVNADDVGPGGVTLVQQAMAQVSAASGIKVRYTGTTSFVPQSGKNRNPGGTDLVIGWANDAEVPGFAKLGADGLGGPTYGFPARDAKGRRVVRTTDAGVVLMTEAYQQYYTPSFESATPTPIGNLILHEVGHAFGLNHSVGTDEMMYGAAWTPDADGVFRSRYAAGDLTGWTKVGLEQGCLRPLRNGRAAPVVGPAPQG
jgi:hypothetical protein